MEMPRFSQNPSNPSLTPLTPDFVANYECRVPFDLVAARVGACKVADFGCGRGPVVAWLRAKGLTVFGVEVEKQYVSTAAEYFGPEVVVMLDETGRSPFADGEFDLVISNQVLEHVRDAGALVSEAHRVTKIGGHGVHMFPSALRPKEPHVYQPFVHWMPPGLARQCVIKMLLALGIGAKWFSSHSLSDQALIFDKFLTEETFYRTPASWKRMFENAGFEVSIAAERDLRAWTKSSKNDLLNARQSANPVSFVTRNFKQTILLMRKLR